MTAILCVIALMLSTPWGSHLTVVIINKTTPITVVYKDGILLKNITFSQLSLKHNNNTEIHAKNVVLKLNAACVWTKKLCIDELNIDDLKITVNQLKQQAEQIPSSNELIKFPFAIEAKKISSRKTFISVNNTVVNAENINTGAFLKRSLLRLSNPSVNKLLITLDSKNKLVNKKAVARPPEKNADNTWSLASLPDINIPLTLQIKKANIGQLILKSNDNEEPNLALTNSLFSLNWHAADLTILDLASNHNLHGAATLAGDISFKFPYQINITAASDLSNIDSIPQLAGTKHKTQFKGTLSSLSFNSKLLGKVQLSALGNIDLTQPTLPFNSELIVEKLDFFDKQLAADKPSSALLDISGDISRQNFTLHAIISAHGYKNAELNLNGHLDDKTLTVKTLTIIDKNTNSMLNLKGKWGYKNGNVFQFDAQSTGVTLPILPEIENFPHGRLAGSIQLKSMLQNNNWSLNIANASLNGSLNDQPIKALGTLAFDSKWQIKPSHFSLTVGDAVLKLNGYTDEFWHVKGELAVPKLEQLIANSRGNLVSTLTIDGLLDNPILKIDGKVTQFYWQDIASPEVLLQASYQLFKQHKTDLIVNSEKLRWKDSELINVGATLLGDIEQQTVNINWLGDLAANFSLTSKWSAKTKKWHALFTDSSIKYLGRMWQTDKNLSLTYDYPTHSVAIQQHCWIGKSVELCVNDDFTIQESGKLTLTADINLAEVGDVFIPDDILVTTKIHNNIDVKWSSPKEIDWSVNTDIEQGNIQLLKSENIEGQPLNVSWKRGTGAFRYNDKKLTSHLRLYPEQSSDKAVLDLEAALELTTNKLSGKFTANNLSLFFLQGYFSEIRELNGTLNADIDIDGTISSPEFNGNINITDTSIKPIRTVNSLDEWQIDIELLGHRALLASEGLINSNKASLLGKLNWQNAFMAEFEINADELELSHPPMASATLSPKLNVKITKDTLKLIGDVNVSKGKLTLLQLPTGSIAVSDDIIIVNDEGIEIEKPTRFNVETDINIYIANNITVSGYGFNGLLGGKLQAKQQPHYPLQLFGDLTISDGLYKAYGQKLSVNNSRLSFNGPIDNPLVDVRAARYISKENVTAGIEIYGPANALAVNLFSTPIKSKTEILSYITRGKGIDTKAQSNNTLGIALGATLANASGVLETIEKIPLINNVELEGDENQAAIAGYIGDNLYLKYGIGVSEPINELTVRFYLLNRLWIETVSGLERSADLYFSFDIE